MGIWNSYENRIASHGSSRREAALKRELHMLSRDLPDTLSYHTVIISGSEYEVAIVNSDNLNEKTIYSTTPNIIDGGEIVEWMNNNWLVVECDANSEIYTKAKLKQCNHLLKWIDTDSVIHEQWCIIEDGTKYLTGEYEDRNFVVTRGDSRIAMTISRNKDTVKFGREHRFLIDDPDSTEKLSYLLTKPLKLGAVYNSHGVYSFVLQEVVSTDNDNHGLGIADYYKYFEKKTPSEDTSDKTDEKDNDSSDEGGKKVWL